MSLTESSYVFICTNKKVKGKCCAMFNSGDAFDHFKKEIARKRHLFDNKRHIRVVRTSCLGKCAFGPNILIYPEKTWYTFSCLEDIDEIIDQHFALGKKVNKFINRGIQDGNTK